MFFTEYFYYKNVLSRLMLHAAISGKEKSLSGNSLPHAFSYYYAYVAGAGVGYVSFLSVAVNVVFFFFVLETSFYKGITFHI